MKYILLLLIVFTCFSKTYAQKQAEITFVDDFYNNKFLDEVLDELQEKYHFKMIYDPKFLRKFHLTFWFENVKLMKGIKESLKQFNGDLLLYTDANNIIHIVGKEEKARVLSMGVSGFGTGTGVKSGVVTGVNPNKVSSVVVPPNSQVVITPVEKAKTVITTNPEAVKIEPEKNVIVSIAEENKPETFNFTLTGKIIDATNGETLPFASIKVRSSKNGAISNVDGYFTLLKVPSDTVILALNYIGYKNRIFYLNPQMSKTNLIIEMEPAVQELDEVEITSEKTEVMKANEVVGMLKMTPRNIAKLPNIGERDVFRAFQLMPGISAANESSAGLYVRGGTPDQTLVLFDGFTVYHVDHLYGFFSAFNYNAIKDVQLYKGGFESKFGGRISGVAEITGKEGNKREINTGLDVSLLSANAFVEGPLGNKITFLVAGRRSWQGPLYGKIFDTFNTKTSTGGSGGSFGPGGGPPGSESVTPTSYFYDLNGKVTFKPTDKDVITLSLYDGTDKLDNSQSVSIGGGIGGGGNSGGFTTTDLSNWGNTGGSLKWSRRWSRKFYSNFLVSYSNYFSKRDNTTNASFTNSKKETQNVKFGTLEDNNLQDKSFKGDFEWKTSETNRVQFGINFSNLNIKYTYAQNDTLTILNKNEKGNLLSLYLQDEIHLMNEKLIVKPGVRMNYFDVTKKSYFEPRYSATYQFNKELKLKTAGGLYYQFAKQVNREDFSSGNRNFWLLSNGDYLPVSSAKHFIVGGSYETDDYLFDVEMYYKDLSNVTEYTLRFTPQVREGLAATETFYTGSGYVKGIDFLVQKKFGDYTGWIGYSLSEAKTNIAQFSNQPFYSNQDARHEFKVVNSYKWGRWDLALTWIYASGKPYTSIEGGYGVKLLDGTAKDFTNPSGKNANRLPNYHRMDVSATYNFPHGSLALSVFNVYGHTNIWYKKFNVVESNNEKSLTVTDVEYLGFTPNLTFSWKLR
jgi:ferric enterobactin receptor